MLKYLCWHMYRLQVLCECNNRVYFLSTLIFSNRQRVKSTWLDAKFPDVSAFHSQHRAQAYVLGFMGKALSSGLK